jgi:hypothetical protein
MGNLLAYCNKEKQYKYFVQFKQEEWKQPNCVTLIFDKKGEYIKREFRVNETLRNKTKKETIEDHLSFASNYVQQANELIVYFMRSFQKEEIEIKQQDIFKDDHFLNIYFKIEDASFQYNMYVNNPKASLLECVIRKKGEVLRIFLNNIPSLDGIGTYVRNHSQIRIKYVNELAQYEKIRKEIAETDW